jgi:ABC-type dipeptide/oligopeptide/nickel transport system permease subunit
MTSDDAVGVALGLLIGVVSGFALLLALRVSASSEVALRTVLATIGQLLALPTFWFGGPWLTSSVMRTVDLAQAVPFYTISLALVFTAIAARPLLRFVIGTGPVAPKRTPRR